MIQTVCKNKIVRHTVSTLMMVMLLLQGHLVACESADGGVVIELRHAENCASHQSKSGHGSHFGHGHHASHGSHGQTCGHPHGGDENTPWALCDVNGHEQGSSCCEITSSSCNDKPLDVDDVVITDAMSEMKFVAIDFVAVVEFLPNSVIRYDGRYISYLPPPTLDSIQSLSTVVLLT